VGGFEGEREKGGRGEERGKEREVRRKSLREREEEHLHHTNRAPGHDRVNEDICVYAHGVACVECIMCIV
jgi:hypothetical protein